tara:strand:+ start:570 stop:1601 length:1032 start_codon:yes stop_codon:yes gene_type:complete
MSKAAELAALIGSQSSLSNRNLIINGAMQVAQRGTQTSITSAYTACDRWNFTRSGAAVVDASQSTDVPSGKGFANSLKIDVTTADTSVAAGDFAHLRTRFEGQDLQQLRKGTSEAKSLTLSFWVKSAKTGTHIVELYDLDNTRQVSKSYSITTADTWQNVTLKFPADTTGAFDNDNAASLQVAWWLLAGSTYSGGTLNTSWASSTDANRVVGQVNVMDNAANNFYLTGVQLEVGETATPFEHRSYGDEFARCQRYHQVYQATGGLQRRYCVNVDRQIFALNPPMRAVPTITMSNISATGMNTNGFRFDQIGRNDSLVIFTQYTGGGSGVVDVSSYKAEIDAEL